MHLTQEIQELVSTVLQDRDEENGEEGEAPLPAQEAGQDFGADGEKGTYTTGSIRNRTDAYQRLSEIADYLAQVEPHSPTPYLVRRAVAWGSMTVMELLQELVQDEGDLRGIYNLLGMRGESDFDS